MSLFQPSPRKRAIKLDGQRWTSVALPDVPRGAGLSVEIVATGDIDAGILTKEDFARFSNDEESNFVPSRGLAANWKEQKRVIQLVISPEEVDKMREGTLVLWNAYSSKKEEVILGMNAVSPRLFLT